MKSILPFTLFLVTMVCSVQVSAELSPQEILTQSDLARGRRVGIQWIVDIDSLENGRKNHRTLLLKAKNENSLARFTAPAKVKGRQILMRERNMWFIKPGLKKPVPISPRQKLMGGASYGDLASTNYSGDYTIAAISDGKAGDETCHIMDLVANNKKVTYSKIRYWISKTRLVGVKAEFYTVSGKILKTADFLYSNRIILEGKEMPFVSEMIIKDGTISANITTLFYSNITTTPINDAAFNLNLLVK